MCIKHTLFLKTVQGKMHLVTIGELPEFRVASNGNRGSVTLIYGDKRKKRTNKCAPGAVWGVGAKPLRGYGPIWDPEPSFTSQNDRKGA